MAYVVELYHWGMQMLAVVFVALMVGFCVGMAVGVASSWV